LGKYYSTTTDSNAFADRNCFAIANSDSRRERSIDIFARAGQSAGRVTLIDVRISDLEPDPKQVETSRSST